MSNDTQTVTLTEFILARIAEDEAAIPTGPPAPWHYATHPYYEGDEHWSMSEHHVRYSRENYSTRVADCWHEDMARHIARHDPARVLAECEAKREVIAECRRSIEREEAERRGGVSVLWGVCVNILRHMTIPYADHPDCRDEWRP